MSVLIKGIEMPKNCCACPLFKSNMSKQLFCKAFGAIDKSDYDKLPKERMKNCPLVPVPPHGRLIDADALKRKQQEDADLFIGSRVDVERRDEALNAVANIVNAPTIIPADEPFGKSEQLNV